jgi:gamma-glutamyl-gamma-aminobutyrate hydrolase PuuD
LYSAVYHDSGYPFDVLADNVVKAMSPDDLKEGDSALVIWGGADINPEYYKHPLHHSTYPGGTRDRIEWGLMQRAIERGIPIIGVCRGAQMLCAAAGGFLIQDVLNHGGYHDVTTHDGKEFRVNSIHHQMLCMEEMPKEDYELIAWTSKNRSVTSKNEPYYGYKKDEQYVPPVGWREPEFVYFPKIRGYAVQWHPEGLPDDCEANRYVLEFIKKKEEERGSYAAITLSCEC